MKKIVSLMIVLALAISMCAVTSVAFAEETQPETPAHAEIIFHADVFNNLPEISGIKKLQGMNDKFNLDNAWAKDAAKVAQIFENIDYELDTSNTNNEFAFKADKDKIYVEYCSPSKEYKDYWSRTGLGSTINAASTGWWGFRYVVTDKDGNSNSSTTEETEKHVLFRTPAIFIYIADEVKPEITKLHSDMTKAMENGIKVGETYTIKTNLTITDKSSTTTTYKVYKKVNGEWNMEDPIYDSVTKEVKEGYEDCISTSGVITMLASDVRPNKEPVYKIIYTVTDALGYSTTTLGDKELTLFAVEETKKLTTAEIWQIVLYVIAGLSAIGIVVVLCIKPKEKAPETGRTAPKKATVNKEDASASKQPAENNDDSDKE